MGDKAWLSMHSNVSMEGREALKGVGWLAFDSLPKEAIQIWKERRRKGAETYLRPRQLREPSENGWLASLLSLDTGSSQRSGRKDMGDAKFAGSCVTVHALV